MFEKFQGLAIFDEVLGAIEKDHGAPIEKIVKCEEQSNSFDFTIIFEDYTLLEARLKIHDVLGTKTVQVSGTYY
jgi:hypothetical protein